MKTQTDKHTATVNLVDGLFTAEEAREVLLSLIQSKIHFHEVNNFSSLEKEGKPDAIARHRIPELLAEREKVMQFIEQAAQKRGVVKITSAIRIELIDEGR